MAQKENYRAMVTKEQASAAAGRTRPRRVAATTATEAFSSS